MSAAVAPRCADGEGGWPQLSDEHLGRNFRAQGHAEGVIEKLASALDQALDDPGVKEKVAELGGSIPPKSRAHAGEIRPLCERGNRTLVANSGRRRVSGRSEINRESNAPT